MRTSEPIVRASFLTGSTSALACSTWILAALALAVQLTGCSQNVDIAKVKAELAQAKEKIAALESELAGLKARTSLTTAATQNPAPIPPTEAPDTKAAQGEPAPDVATTGQQWSYSVADEQMTGGKRKTASVASTNAVEFGFPYNGSQNGHLILRTDPRHGKDVIFRIEQGQILCPSYQGCTVQVRFDDDKASSFSASGPADHSSEVVFLNDYGRFIAKMQKAKRVRLSLDIYQNGRPVFDFDVSGFDVKKYRAKY